MLKCSSFLSISYGSVHRVMGNIQQLFSWHPIYIFPFKTSCRHPELDHLPSHLHCFCPTRFVSTMETPSSHNPRRQVTQEKARQRQDKSGKLWKTKHKKGTREPLAGWLPMVSREGKTNKPSTRTQTRTSKHSQDRSARSDINDPAEKRTGD